MRLDRAWLAPIGLALCGLAAYANSFGGPFILDDLTSIPENPHIRALWPLSRALTAPENTTIVGRPLVALSFALNYAAGGVAVAGYHAVNLGLHVAATLVLWLLLRLTFRSPRLGPRWTVHADGLAAAIAALWAVHPLQTEAVVYVVQRTELMAGLFYLATLAFFALAARDDARWAYGASIASCALGLLCKEVVVSAPIAVLLYDATFVAGSFGTALRARRGFYAGLFATWLVLALLLAGGGTFQATGLGQTVPVTPWSYLLTQSRAIVRYLRLCFWPDPLVLYYDWPAIRAVNDALPCLLVVVPLALVTAWACWRRLPAGFAGAVFFMVLAPSSSVVPIPWELVAERRMYLPLAAVISLVVALAWFVLDRTQPGTSVMAGTALTAAAVLGLGLIARARVADYATEERIWRDTVHKSPASALVRNNLGRALAAQGRLDEAIAEYREGVRLDPADSATRAKLASALSDQGRLDEAALEFARALERSPGDFKTRNNYARALLKQGRVDEAVRELEAAVRLRPDYGLARLNLAGVLARLGRVDEAAAHLQAVTQLPDEDDAVRRRAAADLARLRGGP